MGKYHYFETLEQLSELSERAVTFSCTEKEEGGKKEFSSLRLSCDRLLCELEDALFSDFLPPLERDSIAACAHSLSRVIDQAWELSAHHMPPNSNEEGLVCVRLAEHLTRSVQMLRRLNKPDELPDSQSYRRLLCEGRAAHRSMLEKLRRGTVPRSAAGAIIQTGRLRTELSRAFDEMVEVMLNNI